MKLIEIKTILTSQYKSFNEPVQKKESVSCKHLELNCTLLQNKICFMLKTRMRFYLRYNSINPFFKNKIRFMHKSRIRLYSYLNKPVRKKQIRFMY